MVPLTGRKWQIQPPQCPRVLSLGDFKQIEEDLRKVSELNRYTPRSLKDSIALYTRPEICKFTLRSNTDFG